MKEYQFKNAINGFNKEDVAAYLDAVAAAHSEKIKKMKDQLREAEETIAQMEDERNELQTEYNDKITSLEQDISSLKITSGVEIANIRDGELGADSGDVTELEEELDRQRDLVAQLQDEAESMAQDIDSLETELDEYRNGGAPSGGGDGVDAEELEELRLQVQELKDALASKGGSSNVPEDEIIGELRDDILVMEDEIKELTRQLEEASGGAAPSTESADSGLSDEEKNELLDTIDSLEHEISTLTEKLHEAEEHLEDAEDRLEEHLEAMQNNDGEDSSEEISKLQSELKTAHTRLENMASTIDELETSLDDTELELKQLKSKQSFPVPEAPPVPVVAPAPVVTVDKSPELDNAKMEIASLAVKLKEASSRAEESELKVESMSQTIADLEFMAQGYDARTQQLLSRLDNAERENRRLLSQEEDSDDEQDAVDLQSLRENIQELKESEAKLTAELQVANSMIKSLEDNVSSVSPDVLKELDMITAQLEVANARLAALDDVETQLTQAENELQVVKDALHQEKEHSSSFKSQLDSAQDELESMDRIRVQLQEAQLELESFAKVKIQLREAREDLDAMSRVKSQLRDANEELDAMSKLRIQLKESQEELSDFKKLKEKLIESEFNLETVEKKLVACEEKLEKVTTDAQASVQGELRKLTKDLEELELSLGDEKRHNATLSTELDELREELTKRKNTEWELSEELKKIKMDHDVLAHKVKRLEPPAKAYLDIKDHVETMKNEAQFRAQETINQAEAEVYRVQQQVEQWLARVNSSYSSLCKELDDNISTVDQGLARASNALSQICAVIKTQDSAFTHLGRTISATSSVSRSSATDETDDDGEDDWVESNHSSDWNTTMPDWSTSTIPNSASPSNWSTAPSPLPIDQKSTDLYEALDEVDLKSDFKIL